VNKLLWRLPTILLFILLPIKLIDGSDLQKKFKAREVYAYWTRDVYGHRTKSENLWKDSDGDGAVNYFDARDNDASRRNW